MEDTKTEPAAPPAEPPLPADDAEVAYGTEEARRFFEGTDADREAWREAQKPAARTIAGVPIDVFVKGGTTTTHWDNEQKALAAQSEELRAHQDAQRAEVVRARREGGAIASLLSMQLASQGNPKVLIEYVYRDSALNRECIGELAQLPDSERPGENDLALILVCPYCLKRTGRQDQSQLMIRHSVRPFDVRWSTELDYPQDKRHWVNPLDGSFHNIAGLVTTRDRVKCDALGCSFRFRIDDSQLREC